MLPALQGSSMKTTEVIEVDGAQAVKLPSDFRFDQQRVSIRKQGNAVILEPIRSSTWPDGFFESIRIDDPAFERPEQGSVPPVPTS
jgi:virulence-associated protein VagC